MLNGRSSIRGIHRKLQDGLTNFTFHRSRRTRLRPHADRDAEILGNAHSGSHANSNTDSGGRTFVIEDASVEEPTRHHTTVQVVVTPSSVSSSVTGVAYTTKNGTATSTVTIPPPPARWCSSLVAHAMTIPVIYHAR